ncbi:MAG: hypothetical protein IKP88_01665 [Lachnospiraceae bacterium]|nr:hypothetical protein [Lachnospiraceae bacterium]
MKHFKLMKGVLACLLSLALVISCFGYAGVKADDPEPTTPETTTEAEKFDITVTAPDCVKLTGTDGKDLGLTGIAKDTDVSFKVVISEATKQLKSVKAGDTELEAAQGVYTVKVSAAVTITVEVEDVPVTAEYIAATDTVKFTSSVAGKVLYATVKKAGAKVTKTSEVELKADENDATKFVAEIVLNNKDGGVKVAEDKDLYLWYGFSAPDKKATVKPLLTVDGTKVKKLNVVLNYAVAGTDKCAIASATAKIGKAESVVDLATLQYRYFDGNAWGEWTDVVKATATTTEPTTTTETPEEVTGNGTDDGEATTDGEGETTATVEYNFTGKVLETAVNAAAEGKPAFEIKVKASAAVEAVEASEGVEAVEGKNAVRGSKAAKITVKKAGELKAVKVDYVKGTIAIKNGFDYAVMTEAGKTPTAEDWNTVLPFKKGGTATADIKTVDYVPAKKVSTDTAAMFAKEKVSSKNISDLLGENDTIYVYVRKSATTKAPASKACEVITIKKPAAAPAFTTQSIEGTKGKKGWSYVLTAPEALTGGDYEYLIVKADADLTKISGAKWSKLNAKGIKLGSKSKIDKSTTYTLAADGNYWILIRKAAVKKGDNAALASEYVKTLVGKPVDGGTTEAPTSTISWSVVTEEAPAEETPTETPTEGTDPATEGTDNP